MTWSTFLLALPELFKLVETIVAARNKRASEEAPLTAKELKAALKGIDEAFKNNDSDKLNQVFNSI